MVYSPHKRPVTRKMFPFDDVIMYEEHQTIWNNKPKQSPSRVLIVNILANIRMDNTILNTE